MVNLSDCMKGGLWLELGREKRSAYDAKNRTDIHNSVCIRLTHVHVFYETQKYLKPF